MTEMLLGQNSPRGWIRGGERLLAPDEVASMVQLHQWAEHKADCRRAGVQPEYRCLGAGGWGGESPATPAVTSRRAR